MKDLDLEIEDGTFVALLGPSGCGKSTTMNMLSGLLDPTSGEILFDGKVVNNLKPGDRNIGFVFQNYAIFTHMSAFENIAFGLKIRKRPADEVERGGSAGRPAPRDRGAAATAVRRSCPSTTCRRLRSAAA